MNQKNFLIATSAVVIVLYFAFNSNGSVIVEPPTDLECGFTTHFSTFLQDKGYGSWGFDRSDLKCGSFGGKDTAKETIEKIPVIFIHGNSDVGFGRGTADGYVSWQTGFRSLATYLATQGYKKSEMYTTTWGKANPNDASNNYHSK